MRTIWIVLALFSFNSFAARHVMVTCKTKNIEFKLFENGYEYYSNATLMIDRKVENLGCSLIMNPKSQISWNCSKENFSLEVIVYGHEYGGGPLSAVISIADSDMYNPSVLFNLTCERASKNK